MPRPRSLDTKPTASERARRSMEQHKSLGGADKHWRLSRKAIEALQYIKSVTRTRTEQAVIERLLVEELIRLKAGAKAEKTN